MLVVDAYNVLQVTGVLPTHLAGLEVSDLSALVENSRFGGSVVLLVCDGGPQGRTAEIEVRWDERLKPKKHARTLPREDRPGVRVVFAGPGREADAEIEQILECSSFARRMIVVSSDRRLIRAAARAGAGHQSSERWLSDLIADAERGPGIARGKSHEPVPLDRGLVEQWLRYFNLDELGEELPMPDQDRTNQDEFGRERSSTPRDLSAAEVVRMATRRPTAREERLEDLLAALPENWHGGEAQTDSKKGTNQAASQATGDKRSKGDAEPTAVPRPLVDPRAAGLADKAAAEVTARFDPQELDMQRWMSNAPTNHAGKYDGAEAPDTSGNEREVSLHKLPQNRKPRSDGKGGGGKKGKR